MPRAAGGIERTKPLRHDAFEAKLTSMAKHHVTRFHNMVVNSQPYRRIGEQSNERHPAPLDGLASQIPPIQFEQIEGIQEDAAVLAAVAQPVEARHAIPITGDGLAIEQA